MNKENALVLFHQGFTDIFNCLGLLNILYDKYNLLYVLVREDAWKIFHFYIRGMPRVRPIYTSLENINNVGLPCVDVKRHKITKFEIIGQYEYCFRHYIPVRFPFSDFERQFLAPYKTRAPVTFERAFYEAYGIPYIERVNRFVLNRDPIAEDVFFKRMVKHDEYICTHNNQKLKFFVYPKSDLPQIELEYSTDMYFDAIQVLQKAKEIHAQDSSWAAFCYLIDAKYRLLSHVQIYVYCYRDFDRMFTEPIRLPNWNIIMKDDVASLA